MKIFENADLLAESDWDDWSFGGGYSFKYPYRLQWYRLPSGTILRVSQPYKTGPKWKWDGFLDGEWVTEREFIGDPTSVPLRDDDNALVDMINHNVPACEAEKAVLIGGGDALVP